ncbi:hypothetical protein N5D03_13950 [Empedobacter sp. GD03861]|uniref:hypothetical protein n=1 Tax=Empedobacter sp. GD03861 TaxID=2975390 RepID=UPI00244CBBE2|nr:hypothetical protein [Empedobacter sp. GD03861]MDH0675642.1 hypothetical protein [Empedobacter sp. GD03861]
MADFPPKKAPISCGAGIKKEKKKAPKKEWQRHDKIKNIGLFSVRKKAPKKRKNKSQKRQNPPKIHLKKSRKKPPPKTTKKAL